MTKLSRCRLSSWGWRISQVSLARLELTPPALLLLLALHLQFRNHKLVYRRYAGLFFSFCVDANDNELVWLEAIHLFVEVLGASASPLPRARAARGGWSRASRLAQLAVREAVLTRRLTLFPRNPSARPSPAFALPPLAPTLARADAFFGNVCELDLVFNFYKVYAILDECFLAGEVEETSKQVILDRLEFLERLE